MSAIFGILRFDGGAVLPGEMERMGGTLAHRGPDGRSIAVDGTVGLGHCLLRVNQEDLLEAQPLFDRDAGVTLVADCRIDNREELARIFGIGAAELRGMPDSALILRAYSKWGEACAEHLLGDFCFAAWDVRAQKLVIGRDHMGQRCVAYHRGAHFFAFATEIKALWALPDVPRELDETQLASFLLVAPRAFRGRTLYEDIFALGGGSTLTVRATGELSLRRYWEPHGDPAHRHRDENYYVENYRRVFAAAVECRVRRLIAPPSLRFSAGYDTAAIAGLCGPVLSGKGRKLIAVSSVLAEDYRGSLSCPRRWVDVCRRHMPHLDVRYFVRSGENFFTGLDQAFGTADGIPEITHYAIDALFREAAGAGSRLVMDGFLGDETLNPRGGTALPYLLRSGRLKRFAAEFGRHLQETDQSFWKALRRDVVWPLSPAWARRGWRSARRGFASAWADRAAAPAFAAAIFRRGRLRVSDLAGEPQPYIGPRAQMRQTLDNWTARHPRYAANETAAHGLDLTRPLADKRAVEFGLSVPEELDVRNGRTRALACRALADVYPREFQTRERGQDSVAPDFADMLADARPQLNAEIARLSRSAMLRNYVDFDKLQVRLGGNGTSSKPDVSLLFSARALRAAQYIAWFRKENL